MFVFLAADLRLLSGVHAAGLAADRCLDAAATYVFEGMRALMIDHVFRAAT